MFFSIIYVASLTSSRTILYAECIINHINFVLYSLETVVDVDNQHKDDVTYQEKTMDAI